MSNLDHLSEMARKLIEASQIKDRESTILLATKLDRGLKNARGTPGLWSDRNIRKASEIIQVLKRFKLVKKKKSTSTPILKFCSGGLPSLGKRR